MDEILVPVNLNTTQEGRVTLYLLFVISSVIVCFLVKIIWRRRQFYKVFDNVPGIPTIPILGNAHMFIGVDNEGIYNRITTIISENIDILSKQPLKIWFGPKPVLFFGNPDDLQTIYTSPYSLEKCDEFYKCLRGVVGDSPLLFKPVDKWKPQRKLFQTVLTRMRCFNYVEQLNGVSNDFMEDLDELRGVGVTSSNLRASICTMVTKSVCLCMMGVNCFDKKRIAGLIEGARMITDIGFQRLVKVWYHNETIFKLSKLYRIQQYYFNVCRNFCLWYTEIRKEERAKRKKFNADNMEIEDKNLLDLFIDLLESGEFTDIEVNDECSLFFGAAMDTTTFCTEISLLMIAMYPEVQDKLYEEINGIFENSDRPIEADDVRNMKYLEMVIKESMRLYTPAPIMGRKATKDLKIGDIVVPAGTMLVPSPFAIHHNPTIYPEPEKFDPERFHPDVKRHPYSYLAFSGGPRNCIGYSFALVLMKMIIAKIVRKYKLSTECKHSDIRIKLSMTSKIVDAKSILFEERM